MQVKTKKPPILELYGLAPGVTGYAIKRFGETRIEFIKANSPGSGDVGRFLDSLDSHCVIVNVISDRLRGMLERRGWTMEYDEDKDCDEWRREWQIEK